ncbi:MAG: hypothetical protein JSV77_09315 [Dehalococcoidales bacterium]|nr:MAG: hypothetical protein JSV77_09315 [Dehalococcoidales bacterium]
MTGLIILAVIGGVIYVASGIWLLIISFNESMQHGCLSMIIPFYSLYYVITRWDKSKKPFVIGLVGLVLFVSGIVPTLVQFKGEVEEIVTEFMEAASAGDIDAAYACFSSQLDTEELADFINNNPSLFEGYERISTSSWEVVSSGGITSGSASGTIIYSGERRLPFEVWLIKEQGAWKMTGFYIGS